MPRRRRAHRKPAPPAAGPGGGAAGPGGGGPGTGPGGPGERRRPTAEEAREATRPVMWFSLVLLAALFLPALDVPWPFPLVSGGLAVVALGLGVYALVRLLRAGVRGVVLPVLIVSLLVAGWLAVTSVVQAALWPVYAEYDECTDRALTVQAERRCASELEDAIADRLLG